MRGRLSAPRVQGPHEGLQVLPSWDTVEPKQDGMLGEGPENVLVCLVEKVLVFPFPTNLGDFPGVEAAVHTRAGVGRGMSGD